MDKWLQNLVAEMSEYFPQIDVKRVSDAYAISEKVFKDRTQNETHNDFIFRPRDVVTELMAFRPDEDTLVAAFLYDYVDVDGVDLESVDEEFDGDIVELLECLKILKSIRVLQYQSSDKMDLFRKLFMVIARDLRVLIIFLAVKVTQMKLLEKMPEDCRQGFAKDVLEVFVPIASRLGVYRYKVMLEDLCFRYLKPSEYKDMTIQMDRLGKRKKEYVDHISGTLQEYLKEKNFEDVKVSGRIKGLYSIYNKLNKKGLKSVDEIYDIFAVRVQIDDEDVSKIYEALGHLHSSYRPIASRFKDYIAVPKPNGYRSLHTALLGLSDGVNSFPVEVQIRSKTMHEEAEYGVASHWLYKDIGRSSVSTTSHKQWIDRLSNLHKEMEDGDEGILESLKTDIFDDRIYVLTPRGDIIDLPKKATPLDFAYSVHTDIGHTCVLAKVNGKVLPLDAELSTGDTVTINTKKGGFPKLEWLNVVKTNAAKVKIRSWFASQDEHKHIKIGREQFNLQLQRYGRSALDESLSILKHFGGKRRNYEDREKVLREIGKGTQSANNTIRKLFTYDELLAGVKASDTKFQTKKREIKVEGPALEDKVLVHGMDGVAVRFAQCCKPSVHDKIVGYIASKGVVTVHKSKCLLIGRLNKDRFVKAEFKGVAGQTPLYRVKIRIEADKRIGLLGDIGSRIAAQGVNIFSYHPTEASNDEVAVINMDVDVSDVDQFDKLLNNVEKIEGIRSVTRES